MTKILEHLHAPSLTAVGLTLLIVAHGGTHINRTHQMTPPLLALVTHTNTTHTLSWVQLKVAVEGPSFYNIHALLLALIQPVLVLREMRYFYLNSGSRVSFVGRDTDFATISQAWPQLAVLHMDTSAITTPSLMSSSDYSSDSISQPSEDRNRPVSHDPPYPTTSSLHSFHKNCPRLRLLSFPFSIIPSRLQNYSVPSENVSSHPLEELRSDISWFYPSRDGHPNPMTDELAGQWATHLLALFPKLNAGRGCSLASVKDWQSVCEAMQQIRESRSGS